jgi:hypothetical protein
VERRALALVLHAGFIGVAVAGFRGTGVIPEASAYGSIVLALFLFQWLVVGLPWRCWGPQPRGRGVRRPTFAGTPRLSTRRSWLTSPLGSALVVLATIYLGARLT